ncbi:MAG: RNA polymerase sigma-70 factor [bacterium]
MNASPRHSDNDITEGIRRGDLESFSELFRSYYEPLYYFAARYVRDPGAAENIVQEFFVKLWDVRQSLQITSNLKSYLYTSVKNSCLNYLKHQSFFTSLEFEEDRVDTTNPQPDTQLERNELAEALEKAIKKLPPKCRQIFSMAKYDNLSYQEIAEIEKVSINTVKTQLKRAIKSLSKSLQHLYLILFLLE